MGYVQPEKETLKKRLLIVLKLAPPIIEPLARFPMSRELAQVQRRARSARWRRSRSMTLPEPRR